MFYPYDFWGSLNKNAHNRYDIEAEFFWEHSSRNYPHNVMGFWDNSHLEKIHVAFLCYNFFVNLSSPVKTTTTSHWIEIFLKP